MIVVPGKLDPTLSYEQQFHNAIHFYRQLANECDRAKVTLLFEPLHHGTMNSTMFVSSLAEAIDFCAAVDHPRCRLLFDVYQQHQQLDDLFAGLDAASPWIGHVELGDSHGRKEPGTGSIDFTRLCHQLRKLNYSGLLALEHGNSLPGERGERQLLAAYQQLGLIETDLVTA